MAPVPAGGGTARTPPAALGDTCHWWVFAGSRVLVVAELEILDHPDGLEQTPDRPAGDKTKADVIGLGMLARVIQYHDALGAEEVDCAQVHDQQPASPAVKLAVQDRTEPRRSGTVNLTTDPDDDNALVTVIQRHDNGTT